MKLMSLGEGFERFEANEGLDGERALVLAIDSTYLSYSTLINQTLIIRTSFNNQILAHFMITRNYYYVISVPPG